MEAESLASHFKCLESTGVTLNINERMQLDLALAELKAQFKFEHLHFWGKINGKFVPFLTK